MTTPNPEPEVVNSGLWTFVQIVNHSRYFPLLIRGAAQMRNKTYTQELLEFAASHPAVLTALRVPFDGSVDENIEHLMHTIPEDLDDSLLTIVEQYVEPEPEKNKEPKV